MIALAAAAGVAEAGRKAQNLARLAAAGLPVLDGCVLLPNDTVDVAAIERALGAGPYVVRSSSVLEDRAGASAAGLYASLTGVALGGLSDAIARVRASANDESVTAYLAAHGARSRAIAVLVQPDAGAVPLGVAESGDDAILVEERGVGAPEWADARAFVVKRTFDDPLVALVVAVERVMTSPVAVEYARAAGGPLLLQARPRALRDERTRLPPGRWRLDAEHNPDPLSTAQAALVALVDGRRFGPRLRVIDGYLYDREDQPSASRVASADRLPRFTHEVEPKLRAALAAADGGSWSRVLDTYVAVARAYATRLRPSLTQARATLDAILAAALGESLTDHPAVVAGTGGESVARDAALYRLGRLGHAPESLADYLARFGAYAPAWDVAAACDDEDRSRLLTAAARRAEGPPPDRVRADADLRAKTSTAALRARLPIVEHARFDAALRELRAAIEMAESDDRVFFEAQRLVRRSLLRRGEALVREHRLDAREQVFDLPFEGAGADVRAVAERNRAARARAAQRVPPWRIVDRRAFFATPHANEILRGRGLGGRARGTAFVQRALFGDATSLADVPNGAVLVLPAALPSLAPHLSRLSALVTEHGGALSHAATLAREYGLPAVVGCAGALDIPPGAQVLVDGETGRVFLL